MNPFPLLDALHTRHQPAATPTQGNELDAVFIELREIGIGRKPRIEDQCRGDATAHLGPEIHELQDLTIALRAFDVSLSVD